ncbi:MAG: histone deacetylase family protein [Albidovulum sp.]|nr:histone deacetylase family protein [Albidovulum sp.]MDE0303557.1 histone deacetylase family protein [Albidovulum sp.]MDE0531788.1 histone deacetylase family protein [Albidovulum sp.]
MVTAIITHPDCFGHETPAGHPERTARLKSVAKVLEDPQFAEALRVSAPICPDACIRRAHPDRYVAKIRESIPASGNASLDPDTHASAGTLNAALRAAGANVEAVDLVLTGRAKNAFAAVRPPGHHAEAERAMGFCFFGNAAIGALHALEHYGLQRVAVIDFDVHHGNGSSDLLWNEPRAMFASTHQFPLYPGTGDASETGAFDQIVNVPLPPGSDGSVFRQAMENLIFPRVNEFMPELIIISAGFDAHRRDPLASLNLDERDFSWATHAICDIADEHSKGRVVSTLEGGYDLVALAASTAEHVKALMERSR